MNSSSAFTLAPSSISTGTGVSLAPIGRYRPLLRLGRGGMAEVFLSAWEVAPNVHRPVVVKRLHAHLSDDPALLQMFADEARLACRLDHEHIVRTLETTVIDGSCCIVMEYLEGQPLHRVQRRAFEQGTFPITLAVHVAISVLKALEYAHSATDHHGRPLGIVHRDISPHNVFVTTEGRVKVLDFGIAKANTHEGQTATGFIKGKIGYIAPEQALSAAVDLRADLFSVGVLLWENLVGARLFKADTDAGTLRLTLQEDIPRALSRRPDLPSELDAIVAKALERDPAQRYGSAREMREALQQFMDTSQHRPTDEQLREELERLFGAEIFDQRTLVTSLLQKTESSPSSYNAPGSTSAVLLMPQGSAVAGNGTSPSFEADARRLRTAPLPWVLLTAVLVGVLGFTVVWGYRTQSSAQALRAAVDERAARSAPVPAQAAGLAAQPAAAASAAMPSVYPVTQVPASAVADAAAAVPVAAAALPITHAHARAPARSPQEQFGARSNVGLATVPATTVAPNAEAASFGFLTLDSNPWSTVMLGGRTLGTTPLVGMRLPAGPHTLVLKNAELGLETTYTVEIEAGKTVARRVGLK